VKYLKKELGNNLCEGNHKGGTGFDAIDQLSISKCLKRLKIEPFLMPGWRKFLDAVVNKPSDVFVVDTKTRFLGIVHKVGIAQYDGTPIVDARVDREMLLKEIFLNYHRLDCLNLPAFSEFCAVNQTYEPPRKIQMRGMTPRAIFEAQSFRHE
jgi:hypothetical protein